MKKLVSQWSNRLVQWVRWHPWRTALIILLVPLGALSWAAFAYPDWLTNGESGSATIRNLGLVVVAAIAVPLAIWRSFVAQKQADTAQLGLQNERFQKGAKMLGNDVLAVRLDGIHALEQLAREHPNPYHVRVMQSLCAFARHPRKDEEARSEGEDEAGSEGREEQGSRDIRLRDDVQAALVVIGARRKSDVSLESEADFQPDLRKADLRGAIIANSNLSGVNLAFANISGARIWNTKLHDAALEGAKLSDAHLMGELDLSRACLMDANLRDATLSGVDLSHANLINADLTRTDFSKSDVLKAEFVAARLSGTLFSGAAGDPNASVCNFTQAQLDTAYAYRRQPPVLTGVLDVNTGHPLGVSQWVGDDAPD